MKKLDKMLNEVSGSGSDLIKIATDVKAAADAAVRGVRFRTSTDSAASPAGVAKEFHDALETQLGRLKNFF